jgi:hypothetical protein
MVVRSSAIRAGRPLPPGRFLVLVSVRGWVDPRAIVRLEGLYQSKNPMTSPDNRTRDLPTCSIVASPLKKTERKSSLGFSSWYVQINGQIMCIFLATFNCARAKNKTGEGGLTALTGAVPAFGRHSNVNAVLCSRVPQGTCWDSSSIRLMTLPSKSFPVHLSS